jgi:hypothetical protein
VNGAAKTADASGTIAIESGWLGTTVSIVKKGNGTTTIDSTAQSLTIPARPAAPSVSGGAGKITGTTAALEYSANGTSDWTTCSTTNTIVAAGTYYVRVKQAGNSFTGINSTQITVTPPIGTGSVTIQYWTDDTAALATNTGSATLSRSARATATITAAGSGYSGHQWTLNGTPAGTATTYTFDSTWKGNGTYYIGLRVQKNSVWYSTTITITVTN